jgi:2-polyprenyl-6-methoxyphenol hydroxylase-like FAD-dependent oxidoreductase
MTAIMCRRAVLEGTLRQVVQEEPTVRLRCGCDVAGLTAEPSGMPDVPRVTGVRTRDGGEIDAGTVVVSAGRTAPVAGWLDAIGADPPEEEADPCGLICFTRFFRVHLRPGEDHTITTALTIEGLPGHMVYEIFGADRATFCVEFLPPAWDRELRGLRDEAVHMAAARMLPEIADWLDEGRATPIGPIAAMGRERNVLRRFVKDGRPLALGLHVIGDARCQTNSAYAWGCANALAAAAALADVLSEHPGDHEAQALALEERIGPELAGRIRFSRHRDRALDRAFRGEPEWDGADEEVAFIEGTVLPAAAVDAEVFRAARRWELQLDPVTALLQNTTVLERARGIEPPAEEHSPEPTRDSLLALIAEAAPSA